MTEVSFDHVNLFLDGGVVAVVPVRVSVVGSVFDVDLGLGVTLIGFSVAKGGPGSVTGQRYEWRRRR